MAEPEDSQNVNVESLSPILNYTKTRNFTNNKLRKKSRVKLTERFDDTIKKVNPLDLTLTPSQEANFLKKVDELEPLYNPLNAAIKSESTELQTTALSPIQEKSTLEGQSNSNFGFKTGTNRSIALSDAAIQKHTSLFGDLLNPAENNDHPRTKKYSFLSKSSINKLKVVEETEVIEEESIAKTKDFVNSINLKENEAELDWFNNDCLERAKRKSNDENSNKVGFQAPKRKVLDVIDSEQSKKALKSNSFRSSSSIAMSSKSSNLAQKILNEINCDSTNKTDSSGFQTASGSSLKVSDVALKRSSKLFENIATEISSKENIGLEFSTTSSAQIKRKFNDDDDDKKTDLQTAKRIKEELDSCETEISKKAPENQSSFGFSSASGASIAMSSKSLERAQKIFNEINCDNEIKTSNPPGVQTASKSSTLLKTDKKLDGIDTKISKKNSELKVSTSFGFSSASGHSIAMSSKSSARAQKIFNEINCDIDTNKKKPPIASGNSLVVSEISSKRSSITVSSKSLENPQKMFNKKQQEDVSPKTTSFIRRPQVTTSSSSSNNQKLSAVKTPINSNRKSLGMARITPIHIPKETLQIAKLIFDEDFSTDILPKQNTIYNSTPLKSYSTSTPLKMDTSNFSLNSTITPNKTLNIDKTIINSDSKIILQQPTENPQLDLEEFINLLTERRNTLKSQENLILNAPENHRQKREGVLLVKKEFSDIIPLKTVKHDLNQSSGVVPQNATNLHFPDMKTPTINTLDRAIIVPNTQNLVGVTEIAMGFKAMPGIDPKLIPNGWILNHYKWIVWKLASYQSFSSTLRDSLTIENIIQQLKYRYDREIDKVQRSCLRKIYETDDIAQKRMVLCVSNITKLSNNGYELELTDGWYSIKTMIDEPMCAKVSKGMVQIGTKLITCGAELLHCEGCHPLEATDAVRLKIHYNSTRRALWYAKLGYQRCFEAFPLRIRSLISTGGIVGCIQVMVVRVYPMKYFEKQEKSSVWRNEAAERKRAQEWDNNRSQKIEEIHSNIMKQHQKAEETQRKSSNVSIKEIRELTCPQSLYNLYKNYKDPDSLEEILSLSQKEAIMEYQRRIVYIQEQEMRARIQESVNELHIAKRDVRRVLQIRIIDALDKVIKGVQFQIWNPSDSLSEIIKEGSVVKIYNSTLKRNGDFTSGKLTRYEVIQRQCSEFEKFQRLILPISQIKTTQMPIFYEFDTIGIIIEMNTNINQQHFWLADCSGCLLLVKIYESPKTCSILDSVRIGQTVSISNLTLSRSQFDFGEAYASHYTTISSNPQLPHLQNGITNFNQNLPKSIPEFVKDQIKKVATYREKFNNLQTPQKNFSKLIPDYDEATSPTDEAMSLIDIDKLI